MQIDAGSQGLHQLRSLRAARSVIDESLDVESEVPPVEVLPLP